MLEWWWVFQASSSSYRALPLTSRTTVISARGQRLRWNRSQAPDSCAGIGLPSAALAPVGALQEPLGRSYDRDNVLCGDVNPKGDHRGRDPPIYHWQKIVLVAGCLYHYPFCHPVARQPYDDHQLSNYYSYCKKLSLGILKLLSSASFYQP